MSVQDEPLRRLADLLVPGLDLEDEMSDDLRAFWARPASDLGVHQILGQVLPSLSPHVRNAVVSALRALGPDFVDLDTKEATARWLAVTEAPETVFGARVLQTAICAMAYTIPDSSGRNPTWSVLEFDGPLLDPPSAATFPKTLTSIEVAGSEAHLVADVVVVGSGAGGGVAAARLAGAGLSVVVVEKGGYRNEPDLPQLEALSFPNLYLGGGYLWSTTGSVACLAGSTVGGGTTVNSMACMRTPQFVRAEWAASGMEGVEGPEFDACLSAIMSRINARVENTRHNAVNRILIRALEASGLRWSVLPRNARDDDDRFCGSCNSGCLVGCKQSTMKTFLQDASDGGAVLLAGCEVERILVEAGVAKGVEAFVTGTDGSRTRVVVDAGTVVLAAGALSSPVILQASAIGGPAVGHNLHVHPSYFMSGVFHEVVRGWQGQILTCVCEEFEHERGGHGFLIEAAPMGLGFWTGLTPWHDGHGHKADQLRLPHVSGVWGFTRDHGAGTVTTDAEGRPLITWDLDDDIDLAVVRQCHVRLAELLRVAGAREIFTFLPGDPRWRDGEDFEAFLSKLRSLDASDVFTLSAHQSGTCRTGIDPVTSVVDGRGQLHDVRGVWIVDASALPSAPGVNPMVSIEAFAWKTAGHVLEDRALVDGASSAAASGSGR